MHLIQGTLDSSTTLMTSGAGLFAFGAACYGTRRQLKVEQLLPLAGMTGLVFLAQMVNVATGFGFSAHLVGAALLAVLFRPWVAMLSMAVVLSLQVALLGDGSWSTLGANFITMGVAAPWAGYVVYRLMQGSRAPQVDVAQVVAVAAASVVSIFAASISVSLLVGTAMLPTLTVASAWSVLEAGISVALFALCVRRQAVINVTVLAFKPLALASAFALCLVPFSSQQPDGVEQVVEGSELTIQ